VEDSEESDIGAGDCHVSGFTKTGVASAFKPTPPAIISLKRFLVVLSEFPSARQKNFTTVSLESMYPDQPSEVNSFKYHLQPPM